MVTRGGCVIVAALALAACGTGSPPSGFGINLTVSRAGVDAVRRAAIRETRLMVPDDGGFDVDIEASHFHGTDEARFQYVPGVRSGTLRLSVVARDAGGNDLAAGATGPLTLVAGGAVTARIDLASCTHAAAVGGACRVDCECANNSCVDGRCSTSAKPLGAACTANGECDNGQCVDGFCCGVASCPLCRNCGADGTCSVVVMTMPDPLSCDGTNACDATGACKKANGQSCGGDSECASGGCVDGFCCNDPACGGCQQCDAPGMEGICTAVPDGTDPRGACPAGGPRAEGGYFCLAGACATSCSCPSGTLCDNAGQDPDNGAALCKRCHYCQDGTCKGKVGASTSCNYNVECGSSASCNMGMCGFTCTL